MISVAKIRKKKIACKYYRLRFGYDYLNNYIIPLFQRFYRNFGGEHVSRIVTLVKVAALGAGLGFYLALEQLAALIDNGNGLFKIYHLLAQRESELRVVATGDGYGVAIYLGAYLLFAR